MSNCIQLGPDLLREEQLWARWYRNQPDERFTEVSELDVGADAHPLGRPDEDSDTAVAAGGEERRLVPVGPRLMNEPDGFAGHPAGGEQVAKLVVGVPRRAGGAQVAENQLQRAADGVRCAVRCLVQCPGGRARSR